MALVFPAPSSSCGLNHLDGRTPTFFRCLSQIILAQGLLSLARSFFQAGAQAVIGNLWPVRDDEAAALFGTIYRNLGRGDSVASAVRSAQLERWRAGAPTEAWAGVVVLGDADWRPVLDPRPVGHEVGIVGASLALLALIVVLGFSRGRSNNR